MYIFTFIISEFIVSEDYVFVLSVCLRLVSNSFSWTSVKLGMLRCICGVFAGYWI